MTSPHEDPCAHGTRFGEVVVTVDTAVGDCVVHAPRPGPVVPVMHRTRLNSVEEMQGAYSVQMGYAASNPIAGDIARAIKFAILQLLKRNTGGV